MSYQYNKVNQIFLIQRLIIKLLKKYSTLKIANSKSDRIY